LIRLLELVLLLDDTTEFSSPILCGALSLSVRFLEVTSVTLDAKATLSNVDQDYKGADRKVGGVDDNATLASRKLVDAALADSGNDRSKASENIMTVVKKSSEAGNENLVSTGILPNVALAYIQDDGKVGGKLQRRDNFSAIAGNDGQLSLADLEQTIKNPNGDKIDQLMVQGVLSNKTFKEAYFENKDQTAILKDNQGKELKTESGKAIALDGSYTQEEMKTLLQYEKVKLASQQSPNQSNPSETNTSLLAKDLNINGTIYSNVLEYVDKKYNQNGQGSGDGLVGLEDLNSAIKQSGKDLDKNTTEALTELRDKLQKNDPALPTVEVGGQKYLKYTQDDQLVKQIMATNSSFAMEHPELRDALDQSLTPIAIAKGKPNDHLLSKKALASYVDEQSKRNPNLTAIPRWKAILSNWDNLATVSSADGQEKLLRLDESGKIVLESTSAF
jgi:hypothetical protein